jgi:hypothetical protein
VQLSDLAASHAADAVTIMLGGGTLRIYDADDVTLAELRFAGRAFRPAQAGVALANPLTPDTAAPASGKAVLFRCFTAKEVFVFGGTVGTKDADMVLNSAEIRQGAEVSIESFTYTAWRSWNQDD